MPLTPPSEVTVFASFEDLFAAVNQHAAGERYAAVTKRSKKNKKKELRKIWLRCDHGGEFKPKGFGKREKPSRRNGCPFEMTAALDSGLETWSISIKNPDHNHPPTIAGAHPTHRKTAMTAEIKQTILHQIKIHSTAKQILSSLRLNGNSNNPLLKPKDIYNQQANHRSEKLGPLTPIQSLMRELHHHENWWMAYGADHANQIERLFFVKTTSYKVLKQNHEVLLMDSTYKTNSYRMPLCIISGVTPLNTSFYVGFCFLSSESVEEYQWVLDCIKKIYIELDIPDPTVLATDGDRSIIKAIAAIPKIFPAAKHLLCLWHINKNVVSNCKKAFDSDGWLEFNSTWQGVLYANTEEVFEEKWAAMEIKYHDNWIAMDYLRDEIINPHKENVVRCYTNQVMHFGKTATSRAESQHKKLKGFLHSSTGDLRKVVDAISLLLINEREDYAIAFDQDKFQLPIRLRKNIFSRLAKFVTTYAMRKILEQVERFLEMNKKSEVLRPCTRTFTRSLGLPCMHTIEKRLVRNEPLRIGDVHPHWRFYKPRPTRDANASDIWDDCSPVSNAKRIINTAVLNHLLRNAPSSPFLNRKTLLRRSPPQKIMILIISRESSILPRTTMTNSNSLLRLRTLILS